MKTIRYMYAFLFMTTLLVSCGDDDDPVVDNTVVPTNVAVNFNVAADNSGLVTITPSATGASTFTVFFGDGTGDSAEVAVGSNVQRTYPEGTFDVRVVAESVSGDTAEITQPLVVAFDAVPFEGGLVMNGDFENGVSPWTVGVGTDPAPVTSDGSNSFYSVDVETAGNVFDVNLSQTGITLVDGTNYILTFDAWSDTARSIVAGIGLSGGDFSNTSVPVDLTTSMQTFTLQLTAAGFGDDNSRVLFDSGGEVGMVNIDNVSLVEGGDGSDTPGGDDGGGMSTVMLVNGDFEAGAEPWTIGLGPDAAPIVTENGNSFYQVNVETAGNVFDVNMSQIGLTIVNGTNYILTFDAWSDTARSIVAGIGLSSGDFSNTSVPVDLTTEMQTFTLQITAAGFGDDNSRVLFDSGGEVGMVNIDNVSLVEGGDGSDTPGGDDGGGDTGGGTDTVMLLNGDFEAGAEPWTVGVGMDPAPIVTEGGNSFYQVNVETAGNVFDVNMSQTGLTIVDGTNYILTFDAWSDTARTIVAGIGLSGGDFSNSSSVVDLTTDMQTFTLQLTAAGFGDANSRVLFDSGGEVGMVNIDNVTIVEGGDGSDTP